MPRRSAKQGQLWAVIPAGGSGTRLWPLSRPARPKFLLPLLGERSLLQMTVDRISPLVPPEQTFVICGPEHAAPIIRQLSELPDGNILVEPAARGSGPAIALAAAVIALRDPDAILASFAADLEVSPLTSFEAALNVAMETAREGWIATIGVPPTQPETSNGYVERSDDIIASTGQGMAYRALRFVEKPDLATAAEYVASSHFFWNTSIFVCRAQVLLDEIARLQPNLLATVGRVLEAWKTPEQNLITAEAWASLAEMSIEQLVFEQSERIAVVPGQFRWFNVGDWDNLAELIESDESGNSVRGSLVQSETRNCMVWSETGRLVAIVGLENIAVVDTEDALLVVDRNSAQEVRRIVDQLKTMRQ